MKRQVEEMNPFSEKKSILDSINSLIRPDFKKAKADKEKPVGESNPSFKNENLAS